MHPRKQPSANEGPIYSLTEQPEVKTKKDIVLNDRQVLRRMTKREESERISVHELRGDGTIGFSDAAGSDDEGSATPLPTS